MSGYGSRAVVGVSWIVAVFMAACSTSSAPQPAEGPGQADKPVYGGVLLNRFAISDPPSLDIHRESTFNLMRPLKGAYSNLVRYDPLDPEKFEGDLAEKWVISPDGKTITFTLRKGVKFHNGDEFTSADAKFSTDRILGLISQGPGALVAPRKDLYSVITKVEASDPYTLVFQLSAPNASLFTNFANGLNPVYDKKWIEAGHDPGKEVNGTGPFKLKDYIRGTSFETVKNEQYWNTGRPYLDGVKTLIVPDDNTTMAALRTGQTYIHGPTLAQEEALKKELAAGGDLKNVLDLVPALNATSGAGWFINVNGKPFNDVRVRKALSLSVDRYEVAKLKSGPEGKVASYLVNGSYWALPPDDLVKLPGFGKDINANRAEARKLLADAGYPNGLTVKGMIRNETSYMDDAVVFGDQFKKVGINLEINPTQLTDVYRRAEKSDFEVTNPGGQAQNDDPDTVYGQFLVCGSGRNYSGWCDPKTQELYAKESQTLDPEVRRKIVWELEKYLHEVVPTLDVRSTRDTYYALNKKVRNWAPQKSEYDAMMHDVTWLTK